MFDDAISEEGKSQRFARWEEIGVDLIKADLLAGGHQLVGGPPAVRDLAWEWVRRKEAESPEPEHGAAADDLGLNWADEWLTSHGHTEEFEASFQEDRRRGQELQMQLEQIKARLKHYFPGVQAARALSSAQARLKVFVSYRRDDTKWFTQSLFDRLKSWQTIVEAFMDVEGVEPGSSVQETLDKAVADCHVLLAIIGPLWLTIEDEHGQRRLDNPNDFVRVEIAAALERKIPIIPIFVDGTVTPKQEQLPLVLSKLADRHGLHVDHTSFNQDMGQLETVLTKLSSTIPQRDLIAANEITGGPAQPVDDLGLRRQLEEIIERLWRWLRERWRTCVASLLVAVAALTLIANISNVFEKIAWPFESRTTYVTPDEITCLNEWVLSLAATDSQQEAIQIKTDFLGNYEHFGHVNLGGEPIWKNDVHIVRDIQQRDKWRVVIDMYPGASSKQCMEEGKKEMLGVLYAKPEGMGPGNQRDWYNRLGRLLKPAEPLCYDLAKFEKVNGRILNNSGDVAYQRGLGSCADKLLRAPNHLCTE